ncbi:bifunctional MaoC family dehydratase N-terminal/OB-fold nucleic acid binding domain-containing protein [Streptomyces sp. CA-132043]|uniref:bifunctional MaoC family dehydratase N-terminal/OB-fold nucleic acid binding domain-containing protein n=1 Tax=Streptomyces sp. CA-132043 TaxID=3240048 RepID=UPI003D91AAB0
MDIGVRLKAFVGRAAATAGVGKDRVNLPMIRHWCEAVGDTSPAYTGDAAIAPPTMLQAWTMGGLSGHADRSGAHDELFALLDGAGYTAVVATDCEQEYLRPLRPGDEITFDAVIEAVSDRKTTKLGTGYFVTTRMDIRVGDELAGTHRFRILKYAPGARESAGKGHAGKGPAGKGPAGKGPTSKEPVSKELVSKESVSNRSASNGTASEESAPAASASKEPGPRRPRPVINRDNAGFWAGVAERRLLIQRCGGCGRLRFPWLPGCNACGAEEWDTVEASGGGTVFSYVVMHHPPFPAFDPPYAVAVIELAEGVRMVSDVVGVAHDEVRVGMPVRLEFQQVDEELVLPVFRAAGRTSGVVG